MTFHSLKYENKPDIETMFFMCDIIFKLNFLLTATTEILVAIVEEYSSR